jgi:hypothetical protein
VRIIVICAFAIFYLIFSILFLYANNIRTLYTYTRLKKMEQEYSLGGDMIAVGGNAVTDKIKGALGPNWVWILGALIVLVLVVLWLVMKKESFNPTSTKRMQVASLSGSEAMTGDAQQTYKDLDCAHNKAVGDDAWSWMYGQMQGASNVIDPAALASGSATTASQAAVYQAETMTGKKSDNELSAIAQGF